MPFLLKLGKKQEHIEVMYTSGLDFRIAEEPGYNNITFSLDIQNYNILKRSVLRVKAFLLNLFFGPFIKIELE